MSWMLNELAKWRRSKNKPYEHVDVEMSELRNAIGLKWFLGPGDEQLSPEELGVCPTIRSWRRKPPRNILLTAI